MEWADPTAMSCSSPRRRRDRLLNIASRSGKVVRGRRGGEGFGREGEDDRELHIGCCGAAVRFDGVANARGSLLVGDPRHAAGPRLVRCAVRRNAAIAVCAAWAHCAAQPLHSELRHSAPARPEAAPSAAAAAAVPHIDDVERAFDTDDSNEQDDSIPRPGHQRFAFAGCCAREAEEGEGHVCERAGGRRRRRRAGGAADE